MRKLICLLVFSIICFTFGITFAENGGRSADHIPVLEKKLFIHYPKGHVNEAKPPWAGGGDKSSDCFEDFGRDIIWKQLPLTVYINPSNIDFMSEDFVVWSIVWGAEEWDEWTSQELFYQYWIDYSASVDFSVPDGKNEIAFGFYSDTNAIAVTVVWGYFSGPPKGRRIVEADMLFNNYYWWGDASWDPFVMDVQNIATHEFGHVVGLADLYTAGCSQETMYGYSTYGDLSKRDLFVGDILGIRELYGP